MRAPKQDRAVRRPSPRLRALKSMYRHYLLSVFLFPRRSQSHLCSQPRRVHPRPSNRHATQPIACSRRLCLDRASELQRSQRRDGCVVVVAAGRRGQAGGESATGYGAPVHAVRDVEQEIRAVVLQSLQDAEGHRLALSNTNWRW